MEIKQFKKIIGRKVAEIRKNPPIKSVGSFKSLADILPSWFEKKLKYFEKLEGGEKDV